MRNYRRTRNTFAGGDIVIIAFFMIMFASWLTHIIVSLSTEAWGFLIAGAIFFPIGMIHGIGIWFGAF